MKIAGLSILLLQAAAVRADDNTSLCEPWKISQHTSAYFDPVYAHGLLWRISRGQETPSYLFGTMHLSDPEITQIAPPVRTALMRSQRFVMEALADRQALAEISTASYYRYEDNTSLKTLLGSAFFTKTARLLAPYGITPPVANRMKPWAVYSTLSTRPQKRYAAAEPLDLQLMHLAQQQGKPVQGLETLREQIDTLEHIAVDRHLQDLKVAVCNYEDSIRFIDKLKSLYLARDLGGLLNYSHQLGADEQDFMASVIWQRNTRMVERLDPLLEQGGNFIAIGALHLPGARGVLHLLAQRGYEVRAVY
jgi:hypothetical protein